MLYKSQLPASDSMPSYGLTKNAGTMLLQQIAKDVTPDKLQIINFHPGLIHSDIWQVMGVDKSDLPFDDREYLNIYIYIYIWLCHMC
jgi:NAD(P)-dependent dehydrogenase (short-subunit alcohol dehydrogenase family)